MIDASSSMGVTFVNPENKPLEDLRLVINNNGIAQTIPALDKYWVEKRYFLHYEPPTLIDSEGKCIAGSREQWLELASYIIEDLEWLISLPFFKFWSNIVHNPSIMDAIVIFLQEAPTFYSLEEFPDGDILDKFNQIRKNILIVFARLVTNKESPSEYMSLSKHADLLYNKFIFTVPVLIDLCQQYGRDNKKIVEKIISSVFTSQSLYDQDLIKTVLFITKALTDIERQFENNFTNQEGKIILISEKTGADHEMTLLGLEDIILYLLDIVSSIGIFINIYSVAVSKFKDEQFLTKIVSIYGNCIPQMYKRLQSLAYKDDTIAKYMELKHRLDVIRVEILSVYRSIIRSDVKNILENSNSYSSTDIGLVIEDYFTNLMHSLNEKDFVIDYFNLYPIIEDFQVLLDLHPDLDIVKYQFIVDSIFSFLDERKPSLPSTTKKLTELKIESASSSNNQLLQSINGISNVGSTNANPESKVDLTSLVSEVKDILSSLGEGFIEMCLKHYNYNKESVINAVLENSLPNELNSLDRTLPIIPPDPDEASVMVDVATGVERLNVFDNDEFDVMTKDRIDTTRVHKGKRKDKYKNINELLNDKSEISKSKSLYDKYSIVTSEYDDEYDDTYDDQDIGSSAQDDVIEEDARPFTIPRVLRRPEINDFEELEEENFDVSTDSQIKRDNFIEDPAIIRSRIEERRYSNQRNRSTNFPTRNLVGNPKGQGQSKEVTADRNQKNKNKSARANHNRRAGSQWKRSHGMVPS